MPAVERQTLLGYLDEYLEATATADYAPNGLQVEGRAEIRKIVTGVSACSELFERARDAGADAVLVHHGIFWRGAPRVLTGIQLRRVKLLVENELNLLAYHLPLDRHPVVGNNAVAARRLGLGALEPFAEHEGRPIGFRGRLARPEPLSRFVERCAEVFGQQPLVYADGPDPLTSVAIVSGSAERSFFEAIDLGVDLFLTGEVSEWVMHTAREAGRHFVSAGHYPTERLGVQALGDHLAERFGLEVEFVDLPNPV